MHPLIRRTLPLLFVFVFLAGIFIYANRSRIFSDGQTVAEPSPHAYTMTVASTTLSVEIADDDASRAKGLSGRTSLPRGKGMLFIHPTSDKYGYWMPDMLIALDIVWIDEKGSIVYIVPNATPESYPHVFTSPTPALYVLEVPTGTVARENWHVGDSVVVPAQRP